jgi:hypothetical protein
MICLARDVDLNRIGGGQNEIDLVKIPPLIAEIANGLRSLGAIGIRPAINSPSSSHDRPFGWLVEERSARLYLTSSNTGFVLSYFAVNSPPEASSPRHSSYAAEAPWRSQIFLQQLASADRIK